MKAFDSSGSRIAVFGGVAVFVGSIGALIASVTSTPVGSVLLIGSLLGLLCLAICRWPEIGLALFLTAGTYKGDARLSSVLSGSFDLTVLLGFIVLFSIGYQYLARNVRATHMSLPIVIPYLVLCLLMVLSLGYTSAPTYGMAKASRFLVLVSIAFFAPWFFLHQQAAIGRFLAVFVCLALFMFADVLSSGIGLGERGFRSAFGSNYLALGRVTGLALLSVIFYFLLQGRRFIGTCLCVAILIALLLSLFMGGGRGPVIALIVSIFIVLSLALLVRRKKKQHAAKRKVGIKGRLLATIVACFIIGINIVYHFSGYFETFFWRIQLLQEGDIGERTGRWEAALESMSGVRGVFLGQGVGGFSSVYGSVDDKRGDYPHNIFLEAGAELGILGMGALLYLTVVVWGKLRAILNEQNNERLPYVGFTLAAVYVFLLINACVSGDLTDNRLLFACMGVIHAYEQGQKWSAGINRADGWEPGPGMPSYYGALPLGRAYFR
ncbi:MAG: O-antigen ligase family protein [Candidatus Binatia bacterium]